MEAEQKQVRAMQSGVADCSILIHGPNGRGNILYISLDIYIYIYKL